MMQQFRTSLKSIDRTAAALEALANDTRPAARQLSDTTLPEAEKAIRDLRATTRALRDLTERLNDHGAGAVLSGQQLPDYKP
jgi:phospholipid/cholesterol/gamma-HCH transport system substrate-binding protein